MLNASRSLLPVMLAFVVYMLLSARMFPPLGNLSTAHVGWGDPLLFVWFLHWWPWAVTHGMNPFVTDFVWYPYELNLAWMTSVPTLALLMLPVTMLWNAVVSFNMIALLAPVLGAWATFALTWHITRDFGASLIGGYIFGFSTYEITQLDGGHANLYVAFIPPLLILCALLRLSESMSCKQFIVTTAALLFFQIGLSTEVLASTCVFGAIAWLVFIPFVDVDDRCRMWRLAWESGVAMTLMALFAAPFLYYVAVGMRDLPNHIQSPTTFSADLLNFVIPNPLSRLGRMAFGSIAARFPANYSESSAYLGLPLIVALAAASVQSSARYRLPLGMLVLLFAIFSLGPFLWIDGVQTGIWLPWHIAVDLPLLRHASPVRFTMFVFLVVAVVLARWLAERRSAPVRAARYALVFLGCLFLWPAPIQWAPMPTDPFFAPEAIARELPHADNVIVLPFWDHGPGVAWQVQSGMYFTQTGGYLGPVPTVFAPYKGLVLELIFGTPGPAFANEFTAFVVGNHVADVLAGPGTPQPLLNELAALGWPERTVGDIRIFHVPGKVKLRIKPAGRAD